MQAEQRGLLKIVTGHPFKGNMSIFLFVKLHICGSVTKCFVLLAFMTLNATCIPRNSADLKNGFMNVLF